MFRRREIGTPSTFKKKVQDTMREGPKAIETRLLLTETILSRRRNEDPKTRNTLFTNADQAVLKRNKIMNKAKSAISERAVRQPRNFYFQGYSRYLRQCEVKKSILTFIKRDDNSIISPNKKDFIVRKKFRKLKKFSVEPMSVLYTKNVNEGHPKVSRLPFFH